MVFLNSESRWSLPIGEVGMEKDTLDSVQPYPEESWFHVSDGMLGKDKRKHSIL